MKIGIDGRSLQGEPRGGVGQYTHHLLCALFELDQDNEYVVWYNGTGRIAAPDFSQYKNVRVVRTRWPNKMLNAAMKVTGYRLPVAEADIFFLPNPNFIALPAGVKLVTVAHDLSFEHFPEFFSWKSRLWHKAVNPRALFCRADHLIAVSEHTKNDVVETYGIAPEKVTVVYPGVGQGLGINTETYHLKPDPYILYFGALEPRKNIQGIIEAYERLKPREALIIAGLSTSYVKHIRKRIAQSKLRARMVLKENPTEEEKDALYRGATIFVYPSFYEGFGFPPLEAMASGVPVVASSASAVPEICGNAALLVSPWKVDEIKEGMRVLLEDEALRARYIEAGRLRVQEFSWQKCARQTLDIFNRSGSM